MKESRGEQADESSSPSISPSDKGAEPLTQEEFDARWVYYIERSHAEIAMAGYHWRPEPKEPQRADRPARRELSMMLASSSGIVAAVGAMVLMRDLVPRDDYVILGTLVLAIVSPLTWLFVLHVYRKNSGGRQRSHIGELAAFMEPQRAMIWFRPEGLWYADTRHFFCVPWLVGASLREEENLTWVMMGTKRMLAIPTLRVVMEGERAEDDLARAVREQSAYPSGTTEARAEYFRIASIACPGCKHELRGCKGDRCPECGREIQFSDLPIAWWAETQRQVEDAENLNEAEAAAAAALEALRLQKQAGGDTKSPSAS